ncbi:hypothetical protein OPV22_015161 [Ensete ventricosum]|uniref:Uncharacterized protein n=1 Tax=Ensete ventricosum TaxID=4639 RepID=A0AAV8R378_ENSVE|nr:hypothetical protein OPV22_015161 [Ensete ventricosum]
MKSIIVHACRILLIAVAILLYQFHSSEAHRDEVSFSIKLSSNVTGIISSTSNIFFCFEGIWTGSMIPKMLQNDPDTRKSYMRLTEDC